ncbi:MAG: prephenate dehydrogenase [Candidatus Omnitrophota bacterium]
MKFKKVAIFGVGLIGGSVGLGLKKRQMAEQVIGVGRRQESLEKAKTLGAIDTYTLKVVEGLADADLIILAAPVNTVLELLETGLSFLKDHRLLTDVCSSKKVVVDTAERSLPPHLSFVGGHPIAGSEKNGAESASADLFVDRVTVLTPTLKTRLPDFERIQTLWESLGSKVLSLTPDEHDRVLAITSHIPHLLAVSASLLVEQSPIPNKENFIGTGFRDLTRIAEGEPSLWQHIFLTNSDHILENLTLLEKIIAEWKDALKKHDLERLLKLLNSAAQFRKTL